LRLLDAFLDDIRCGDIIHLDVKVFLS